MGSFLLKPSPLVFDNRLFVNNDSKLLSGLYVPTIVLNSWRTHLPLPLCPLAGSADSLHIHPSLSPTAATTTSCLSYGNCLLTGDFLLLLFTSLLSSFQTALRVIFFKWTTDFVTAPLKHPAMASKNFRIKPRAHKSPPDLSPAYLSIQFRATCQPHWFYFCPSDTQSLLGLASRCLHFLFCLKSSSHSLE